MKKEGLRGRLQKGQITLEYLLILGFTFTILIPGILFLSSYNKGSLSRFHSAQYEKLGATILNAAVETLAQGKGSWMTLNVLVPESIRDIRVSDNGQELVVTYETPFGDRDAVFFSDVELEGVAGKESSIYLDKTHGGRLILKVVATDVDTVAVEEDNGSWTPPPAICTSDSQCPGSVKYKENCSYGGFCDNGKCQFKGKKSLSEFGDCIGSATLSGGFCTYQPPTQPSCTVNGWDCQYQTLQEECFPAGTIKETTCWYNPGTPDCDTSGCNVLKDSDKPCNDAVCDAKNGWDGSLCSCNPYYAYYDYNDDSNLNKSDEEILLKKYVRDKCPVDKVCDINGDGSLSSDDTTELQNIINETVDAGEVCFDTVDNNCDGVVDTKDENCCGASKKPCCAGAVCNKGLTCVNDICK